MPSELDTDSHREEAKEGKCMPITIEENTDEAIETFARLLILGHFAKAANLFEDVLKPYLDELPAFAEYANFLVQQGKYGVLLDRVNERISTQADVKLEEDETVYLELLRALSMLHFEGQLMKVLDALGTRRDFYSTLIRPPGELNYIQIRSVQTYLAIITAVILVTPKWAIEYTHKVVIQLSGKKTYVLETGAAATSDSPWAELQDWCILLGKEHPQEAVNVFRTLLDVLPAHRTTLSWVSNFISSIRSSQRGPLFILAKIGAINAWMSFRHRHHLRTMTVPGSGRDKTTTGAGDASIEEQETLTDSGDEAMMEEEEAAMDTEASSRLLDELYEVGYDARSQQVIELKINKIVAGRRDHRLKLRDLADIAREEANYRLESYCFQLMVEMDEDESMFFAVSPLLEFSGPLYSHIAHDVVDLVNFLDRLFPDPLHTTVSIGSLAAVRLLLERGDESWALDEQGFTCIHQAAFKGYEAIAQLFLEHDRNLLSCVDENGYLPLHVAAENGRNAILRLFLNSDKEHVNAQVQKEAHGDERHHAEKYKKLGRLRKSSDEAGQGTGTALHLAAANGHEGIVTSLLQCEAMVNEEDVKGWTALHKASARWQYGVANILLRHGAKVNSKTKEGLTALDLATKSGHTALVDLLLQHHAEVSGPDGSGEALRFSAEIGDLETLTLLLEHKADIKAKGDRGSTAMHLAAKNGHSDVVRFLLEHGADIEGEDDGGNTALHLAKESGNPEIAQNLPDKGAKTVAGHIGKIGKAGELRADTISSKFLKEFDLHGLDNPRFLPRGQFGQLTGLNVVEQTIQKHCRGSNVTRLVEYSTKNPRLFLTCVLFKQVSSIPSLCAAGLTDGSLPVEGTANSSTIKSFDRKKTWNWNDFGNQDGPWDWDEKNRFLDYQWSFSAIRFKDNRFSFKISKKCPLPYIPLERATSKGNQGYFGEVHKVGLLKEHLQRGLPGIYHW